MITTLTGNDGFALKAALDERIKKFVQTYDELALERLDGEEVGKEQILDALQSAPFLSEAKMVVVRSVAKQKELLDTIEAWAPNVPDSTQVILYDTKIDKRAKHYKLLQKLTDFQEFSESSGPEISQWIVQQTTSKEGKISSSDARYLAQLVGSDKTRLSNELDKLILYDHQISKNSIDELVEPSPQSTVFQLLDAAFAGDYKKAATLYEDQRAQRVEPLAILGMIAWQLHILALVKTAGNRSGQEIAREAKLSPFVVQKTQAIARRISLNELKKILRAAAQLDGRLKSESIDADSAMHQLLLSLGSKA